MQAEKCVYNKLNIKCSSTFPNLWITQGKTRQSNTNETNTVFPAVVLRCSVTNSKYKKRLIGAALCPVNIYHPKCGDSPCVTPFTVHAQTHIDMAQNILADWPEGPGLRTCWECTECSPECVYMSTIRLMFINTFCCVEWNCSEPWHSPAYF